MAGPIWQQRVSIFSVRRGFPERFCLFFDLTHSKSDHVSIWRTTDVRNLPRSGEKLSCGTPVSSHQIHVTRMAVNNVFPIWHPCSVVVGLHLSNLTQHRAGDRDYPKRKAR